MDECKSFGVAAGVNKGINEEEQGGVGWCGLVLVDEEGEERR